MRTKKNIVILIIIAVCVVIAAAVGWLILQTRIFARSAVVGENCSTVDQYRSDNYAYCARVTEVQRFFDRGSRLAEYDVYVYRSDGSIKPKERTEYGYFKKDIFAPYHGRHEPGQPFSISWQTDGLELKNAKKVVIPAQEFTGGR